MTSQLLFINRDTIAVCTAHVRVPPKGNLKGANSEKKKSKKDSDDLLDLKTLNIFGGLWSFPLGGDCHIYTYKHINPIIEIYGT